MDHYFFMLFMICDCHVFLSGIASWESADLMALWYVKYYCVFVTFPRGVLGQVCCMIVSIPDLCLLSYFNIEMIKIDICLRFLL